MELRLVQGPAYITNIRSILPEAAFLTGGIVSWNVLVLINGILDMREQFLPCGWEKELLRKELVMEFRY